MMLPLKDETLNTTTRSSNPSTLAWFFLSFEFLIGFAISGVLSALGAIKSVLPKPPRDITGDVVVVVGASSSLGETLAEEFVRGGCSVLCLDNDLKSAVEMTSRLRSQYPRIEEVGPRRTKHGASKQKPVVAAYECNLTDHNDIRCIARKVKNDVGRVDVLVTCVGSTNEDIFDTASTTLLSHYWAVLAFLPSLLHGERAYVVGITPVAFDEDSYIGSRSAIAGLMDSLGEELAHGDNHLTFITVAPIAERRFLREKEQQVARDIVQAVRRDLTSLNVGWAWELFYRISCVIYGAITTIIQWLHTQGCDYSV